ISVVFNSFADAFGLMDRERSSESRQPRSGAPHRASGHRDGTESVRRNVKRWQNTGMALRWTAAGILEAAKISPSCRSFCKRLPELAVSSIVSGDRARGTIRACGSPVAFNAFRASGGLQAEAVKRTCISQNFNDRAPVRDPFRLAIVGE